MDGPPIPFLPLQSEVTAEAVFAAPAFEVLSDTNALARLLLDRMGPLGLRLSDIRQDTGTTMAEAGLTCYFNNVTWTARIRADRVDLYCLDVTHADRAKLKMTSLALFGTVAEFAQRSRFESHRLIVNLHGTIGFAIDQFLLRFTRNAPSLGALRSSGAAFYFDARPSDGLLSSSVTIDRSLYVPEGLFLGVQALWAASDVPFDTLADVAEKHLDDAVRAIGLQIPEVPS